MASQVAHVWADIRNEQQSGSVATDVDLRLDQFDSPAHREVVREALEHCFTRVWGAPAKVIFFDEHPSD